MKLSFEPVLLDTDDGDGEAMLLFADGRLAAVASRLSEAHGDDSGRWFIEAVFGTHRHQPRSSFASLDEAGQWLLTEGAEDGGAPSMRFGQRTG